MFVTVSNVSDSQCVSSADRSADWLMDNFGSFSNFASITDFYELNPYFSGVSLNTETNMLDFCCCLESVFAEGVSKMMSLKLCVIKLLLSSSPQLEALPVLSSEQLAELLLLPLRTPPEKDAVIDRVFDFLLESPQTGRFPEVLLFVVELAGEVTTFAQTQIFTQL